MFKRVCKKCGYVNDKKDVVCYKCGATIDPKYKDDPNFIYYDKSTHSKVNGNMGLLIFCTFIIPIISLIAGITYLFDKERRDDGILLVAMSILVPIIYYSLWIVVPILIYKFG